MHGEGRTATAFERGPGSLASRRSGVPVRSLVVRGVAIARIEKGEEKERRGTSNHIEKQKQEEEGREGKTR